MPLARPDDSQTKQIKKTRESDLPHRCVTAVIHRENGGAPYIIL
jgi:hypothetical protein